MSTPGLFIQCNPNGAASQSPGLLLPWVEAPYIICYPNGVVPRRVSLRTQDATALQLGDMHPSPFPRVEATLGSGS
jgi:hypothetical protein